MERTHDKETKEELTRLSAERSEKNIDEGMRTRNRVYYIDVINGELVLNAEAVNSDIGTPKSFKEAFFRKDKKKWITSML